MNTSQIIGKFNSENSSYHSLIFPDNTILNGSIDMKKYLPYYKIPQNLEGKTILDVGCAEGFFSFEFAKRGGKVTAIDTNSTLIDLHKASNSLMKTDVKFLQKDLFELNSEYGEFDLVFCSNLLMHLSDPISALKKLRDLTKNQLILCTAISNNPKYDNEDIAFFQGGKGKTKDGKTYATYFIPTMKCLEKMLYFVEFKNVKQMEIFDLENKSEVVLARDGVIHAFA